MNTIQKSVVRSSDRSALFYSTNSLINLIFLPKSIVFYHKRLHSSFSLKKKLPISFIKAKKKYQTRKQTHYTTLTLVLPYSTKDPEYYEKFYDDIIIYEAEKPPHFKRAITERNRFMVDMVDMVIAYVDKQEGGAYQAMRYVQLKSRELVVLRGQVNHHWE